MGIIETIAVVGPILAVLMGAGLWKRDRREEGGALVALGGIAVLILLVLGHARPMVGLVAILGLVSGIVADERGRRVWGLLGISVGLFALIIAVMYT